MRSSRVTFIVIVVVVTIASSVALLSYEGYFRSPTTSDAHVDHFTIIEEDPPGPLAGMNGSYYKSATTQWPVINVHQGDTVVITVINNGTSEPHGFAIDHYFNSGVSTSPGQSHTITFVANEVGTFRMYCDIFCSIHPLMQNGALVVSAS
jgi:FtsP/CotA-like multicopper oxidase with cupredoxin domain